MVFLIRPAAVSDAGALALIKQNVWQTAYKNIYPKQKIENFDLAAQTQYFARLAADSRVSLFVAEVQGKCAGYMAAGEKERRSVGQNGEILLLNLHSSCRGQGIGRALFAQDEDVPDRSLPQVYFRYTL